MQQWRAWTAAIAVAAVTAAGLLRAGESVPAHGAPAPETADERVPANVAAEVKKLGIRHAVAIDNDFRTWRAYGIRVWPTVLLIDRKGKIRHRFEGELGW